MNKYTEFMENNIRLENAEKIVRNHMIWSMGAGLLPVPIADFFAVSAIQLDMVRQLSKLYERDFSENETKAVISALTSSIVAKVGARAAIKLIPGLGSVVGGVTMSVLSGASTYAIGETFKRHFESGGTILDFDIDQLKKVFDEKFEKGKKYAQDVKRDEEQKEDMLKRQPIIEKDDEKDVVQKLRELALLRDQGIVSDEEFEVLKKKIIES